jgi:RHS repeat-associated protein
MWSHIADAIWQGGKLRHVLSSQQGVPQELLDSRGRLVWQGTFDDWGKLVAESGETSCRLRLPGQLFDEETGLHYNRHRYYLPEAGQFISPDPLGYGRSKNLFRFAPNAIRWIDPLGLECWMHAAQKEGAERRKATEGDADFPSREAAMAEACKRHGIDPETVEVKQMYGDNPNLKGPKGQPWEQISGLNANGDIVTFDNHSNGHFFQDPSGATKGEYEMPHFHGPNGEHLCYEP